MAYSYLPSQNPRCDEDQQLAARIGQRVAPEQPAEQRNAMQHRGAVVGRLLLADEDAADDRRRAVVDLHPGHRALRVDRRNAVDLSAEVRRRVLDRDVHDHGVRGRDLRRHLEQQHGVLELHGDGVVGDGLNRNLDALRDLGFLVVLRRQARRGQHASLARVLERGERDVEIERAVDRRRAPGRWPTRRPRRRG